MGEAFITRRGGGTALEAPAEPIADMSHATLALATTGGVVPKGNPEHIPSSGASAWGEYNISGVLDLTSESWETASGGYDPTSVNADPDRMVPVDSMRDAEKEGSIGRLFDTLYSTVGHGMTVDAAKLIGQGIGAKLKLQGVEGVILTAADGPSTRAGAAIAEEIEKMGIPVAIICTVTPIAQSFGAWRIVAGYSINSPMGNPALTLSEEKALRAGILQKALMALKTAVTEPTIFE